jgi:hypothetical protein
MAKRIYGGYSLGVASERLNGVKQSGSRTIREPTWYFQSKLLVSYNRKDNMSVRMCQENMDRNQGRIQKCYNPPGAAMKAQSVFSFLFVICLVTACQTATSSAPGAAALSTEITLAPGQSAAVTGTDLTITFHSIVSDERCPSQIECAASGPVSISLSIQQGEGDPTDFTLQTFTDLNGRSPNVQFEGVTNRTELGDYAIQIASVTPYPQNLNTKIEASEYRVALLVSNR